MTGTHTPAIPPTSSRTRIGAMIAGAALVSAAGVGAMAFTATSAAFTGQTDNTGNSFSAATVSLSDNDGGSAMFNAGAMIPGDSVSDCIEITYTGSSTDLAGLRLFGSATGDLAANLDLDVVRGAAGSSCAAIGSTTSVYSGDIGSIGSDYASGEAGLTPSATNEVVAYQFTVTLDAATPNTAQGDTAAASFTWEVRSN